MDNKWHFVSREREREGTEWERKEEAHREDGGGAGFLRTLQSGALICRSKMPYHMTCLTFGPHSAKTVRVLSNREHKASQPQRPLFIPPPPSSHTPKVIGKSNVNDLHFPPLHRRAKLLRFPDNVKASAAAIPAPELPV